MTNQKRRKAPERPRTNVKTMTLGIPKGIDLKRNHEALVAFKGLMDAHAERICDSIEKGVLSEFEKGQIDGVMWLRDVCEMDLELE